MSVKQNTLKGEFSLKGKGLHTGKEVCATFKPAAENTGYKIVRVDLDEKTEIPALAKYIELVDRASCLQKDGAKVYTLEHAMAALYGCGIDNCVIELSGEEFPILDGSARYYVEEIQKVGIEEQQRRPRPAAETGRSCWGSVLIFQGPAKGLKKNQQTQPVRRHIAP